MSISTSSQTTSATEIRPFRVEVQEEKLTELRRRIAATQWPERETVADQSQGLPLAMMQDSRATGPQATTGAGARRR